jgi:hypothetical protein
MPPHGALNDAEFSGNKRIRVITAPIIRFLTERLTNWRIWDDVRREFKCQAHTVFTLQQKSRRQILTTRARPVPEAKSRRDTTVFDGLINSPLVSSILGERGFIRLSQVSTLRNP